MRFATSVTPFAPLLPSPPPLWVGLAGKAKFIAERAISITAEDVRTKSHAFVLEHPAIDCTGFDMTQSLAGGLFEFVQGHCGVTARLTIEDESTQ